MQHKAYERHWSIAQGNPLAMPPFSSESSASSEAGDSLTRTFALRFPHACKIKKLAVRQADGVAVPFQADLLNARGVPHTAAASLSKVMPTQSQPTAGAALEVFDTEGYTFTNMEGTPTNPVQMIYLRLTLLGNPGGPSSWEVSLAGETMY